jgi:hypothetical protein
MKNVLKAEFFIILNFPPVLLLAAISVFINQNAAISIVLLKVFIFVLQRIGVKYEA